MRALQAVRRLEKFLRTTPLGGAIMVGMTALRRRPGYSRLRVGGVLIGLTLMATACAGSGYQYVADRETQSFF